MKRAQRRVREAIQPPEDLDRGTGTCSEAEALVLCPVDLTSRRFPTKESTSESPNQLLCLNEFGLRNMPDPAADSHFLILQSVRSCEAFSQIARILQLRCTYSIGIHVSPSSLLPPTLAPTYEQQTVPHKMYIDMLPWPSLRNNLIAAPNVVNEEEFTLDMASGELKVWGLTPWDPLGWEVGDQFLKKWWFLLDAGILQATNFWRSQRGERSLTFPNGWDGIG